MSKTGLEDTSKHIQVIFNQVVVAETRRARRVLETSHPPVYYLPPDDIDLACLVPAGQSSWCEWKGQASYYTVLVGDKQASKAAWYYPDPASPFEAIKHYVAFYPHLMDACTIDGERVRPQAGGFYGGWITRDIVGPFKGEPGTMGW